MSKTKNINFEDAMKSLEDSVARLEGGTLTLDEALSEFEKAIGLVKICEKKIEDAKQKSVAEIREELSKLVEKASAFGVEQEEFQMMVKELYDRGGEQS